MRFIVQTWVKGLNIHKLLFDKWNQKDVLYQEFLRYHSLDTLSRNTFILIPVKYIPNSSLDTVVYIYVYAQKFVKYFKNKYTQVSLLFCFHFINTQYIKTTKRKYNNDQVFLNNIRPVCLFGTNFTLCVFYVKQKY